MRELCNQGEQHIRPERPENRNVRVWPQQAIPTLQGCFETTQWDIFKEAATYDS